MSTPTTTAPTSEDVSLNALHLSVERAGLESTTVDNNGTKEPLSTAAKSQSAKSKATKGKAVKGKAVKGKAVKAKTTSKRSKAKPVVLDVEGVETKKATPQKKKSKKVSAKKASQSKSRSSLPVKAPRESVAKVDLLQQYFREIRKYPLLSKEEEYELAVRFEKTRDPDLAFRMTTANLRLVVKIAMEYQSAAANLLDLIQEGNIGLMQAVKKFDPFKGIRLSSYAQWWIRAYILKYLVNNARMVKVGTTQAQRKLFFNLRKEKDRLEALGFKPSPALLAARLDVREEEVREMEQRLSRADVSLDAPLGDGEKTKVSDFFAADDADVEEKVIEHAMFHKIRGHMGEFVKTLKDRQRIIWEKRLDTDEPLTLQQIGDEFGVTRERARQIEQEIKNRFREYLQKQMPDLDANDLLSL